jgi:hypothetical protein
MSSSLRVAKKLFGDRVIEAVATAAHRLGDARGAGLLTEGERDELAALIGARSAPAPVGASGVAAPAPVLQVSVRGRLVAPTRLFRFLRRGITGARRLLAFALLPIVASAELCCLLVGQGVLPS